MMPDPIITFSQLTSSCWLHMASSCCSWVNADLLMLLLVKWAYTLVSVLLS